MKMMIIFVSRLIMIGASSSSSSTGMIDITKDPLASLINNNYRTAEIIAYLKSLCDE